MTQHERIIRNALDATRVHGASFGAGGKAMTEVYAAEDDMPRSQLLEIIAIMANGLAAFHARQGGIRVDEWEGEVD